MFVPLLLAVIPMNVFWMLYPGCIPIGALLGYLACKLAELIKAKYYSSFCRFLAQRLNRIYLYGIPVFRLYSDQFFPRYRYTFDYGFCYSIAALTMMTLRGVTSSRIVLADAVDCRGDTFEHEWVEFRYGGIWWVIDPTWCEPFFVRRSALYKKRQPKIKKVCEHDEFWAYPLSPQFEEKLQNPATSFLFFELYVYYSHYDGRPEMFHPRLADMDELPWHGRYTSSWAFACFPDEILFSKPIVHDFMAKPTRLRPKAKHIRYARKLRRITRRRLDEIMAEEETDANSDSSAQTDTSESEKETA